MFVVNCLLVAVPWLLFVAGCKPSLINGRCLLFVVCCLLVVVCCSSLPVGCLSLLDGCCVLLVVRC